MRRTVRIALILLIIGGAVVAAGVWRAGRTGSGSLEQWIGGQIHLVADAYLVPRLSFSDLDYAFPSTIHLKKLRLSAEDPANPGRMIDILAAESAAIELTEIPRPGKPVHIASIILTRPLFQAVRVGGGSARLVGFSRLLKATDLATQPGDAVTLVPRISEFIQVRHVELIDGRLISDPRLPGVPAMTLDQINTTLAVEREGGGWYALTTRIARAPVFDLAIAGRLNLDTFTARDATVTLTAQVGREQDGYLPSEMQALLRAHEVRGALEVKLSGDLPLLDPARGTIDAAVTLRKANLSVGDYRLPIEALQMQAKLADGRMDLSALNVQALRGRAGVTGTLQLNAALDADLKVAIENVMLDDTIRDGTQSAREPKYGGRMSASIGAAAPLTALLAHVQAAAGGGGGTGGGGGAGGGVGQDADLADLAAFASSATKGLDPLPAHWGQGRIDIDQGRLMFIPLVRILGNTINRGKSLLTGRGGGKGRGTDRATVTFELAGDRARCTEITYVGALFAARGRGTVSVAQALDLIVNAGPLEKMQNVIGGRIGQLFGKVTDALASYRVTGTIEQPKVQVQLVGINRAGSAVKSGVGRIVGAVGGGGAD